jgi:predicted nucleic-acid-binding protein
MGREKVKITVDTNILIRAVVRDDERQARAASRLLKNADLIAVSLPCLCEFTWVLRRLYRYERQDIATAIRALLDTANVAVNRPAAESGLAVLEAGGDFADGVIAFEGEWLGGSVFVSFDEKAVSLLARQGRPTRRLT